MKKLGEMKIYGTTEDGKQPLRLDEISILAKSDVIQSIGVFLINAAYEMKVNDIDNLHFQDLIDSFSYKKHVDIIVVNQGRIKLTKG